MIAARPFRIMARGFTASRFSRHFRGADLGGASFRWFRFAIPPANLFRASGSFLTADFRTTDFRATDTTCSHTLARTGDSPSIYDSESRQSSFTGPPFTSSLFTAPRAGGSSEISRWWSEPRRAQPPVHIAKRTAPRRERKKHPIHQPKSVPFSCPH